MISPTFGALAQGAIAKYLKQATGYEAAVLADTDPEDLHQMRVGLRRLRTALQVFEAGIDLPKAAREPKVAKIGRRLGQLRDLDVIGDTLRNQYLPRLPKGEQVALLAVIDHLAQARQRAYRDVKQLLTGKSYRTITQALRAWVQTPTYRPLGQCSAAAVVPDVVLPLMGDLWLHPGWWVGAQVVAHRPTIQTHLSLAAADSLIAEQGYLLHSLRKQIKRVRYQLRVVAPLYGDLLEADLERFSTMQDTLGALQDSAVLAQFIAQAHAEASHPMPTLRNLLAQSRHQSWQQWQIDQKHYLDAVVRQDLRLTLLQPGRQPRAVAPAALPVR
ncbi:CHAD domain-containing protein [Leptolyngbya sp. BL0902]|uniref:CHAD domain-containing protein n=1 Tax=Leptolyngbya sp. BL0902 TaxID=1115757 RepID=UPI0018E889C5|nr:CHAD domain-containing protein [Leptolyngbya sp. BL0902]QQE63883.1 CHAD domain-containing protein [Leptolyngbya sp. BL0902]